MSVDEALIINNLRGTKYFPMICEVEYEGNDIHTAYQALIPEFRNFCKSAGVQNIDLVPSYLDNLQRLKVLEVRQTPFEELENKDLSYYTRPYDESPSYQLKEGRQEAVYVTNFGMQFLEACVSRT